MASCVTPYYKRNKRGEWMALPCGHCLNCLKRYQNDWAMRLKQEAKNSVRAFFVTLTYNDDHVPYLPDGELVLKKEDYQNFLKRLRKLISPNKIRYFGIGEYGGQFERPHYHLMIFNLPALTLRECLLLCEQAWSYKVSNKKDAESVPIGFVKVEWLETGNLFYITKYLNKLDDRPHSVPPFRTMSNRNAIGSSFINDKQKKYYNSTLSNFMVDNGRKYSLPRFYRDRLFGEKELDEVKFRATVAAKLAHSNKTQEQIESERIDCERIIRKIRDKNFGHGRKKKKGDK